jgi:hypothetical protein
LNKRIVRCLYGALVALVLLAMGVTGGGSPGSVRAQDDSREIGAVEVVALDGTGNGWAWAGPPAQTFAANFILRIEGGRWRIAHSSEGDGAILPPAARLTRIVLTERGDAGWAIGSAPHATVAEARVPLVMRLLNGRWEVRRTSLPASFVLYDVAITPNESDGWMTGWDSREGRYRLLRLRNGAWDFVANPPGGGALHRVSISPDGTQALGVGPRNRANDVYAPHAVYRFLNGQWEVSTGNLYNPNYVPVSMTVDNGGNGWVVNQFQPHIMASRVITSPLPQQVALRSALYWLPRNGPSREINLNFTAPGGNPDAEFYFDSVSVDANGRGWAAGSFFLGIKNDEPPEYIHLYEPVLFRLNAGGMQRVDAAGVGFGGAGNLKPLSVAVTRNGAHTWVSGHDGIGFGHIQEIREPWAHARPPAANPLPGAGVCFSQVPHCLRGVFAQFWQSRGGLNLFGYPITPEVREVIGGKEYLVQYTQRARFEYHPENPAPNNVLLGLLGNTLAEPRLNEEPFKPKSPGIVPSEEWFPQTQHNVRPPFLDFWKRNGGLPVYGLPRSEAFEERNAADGKTYLVQYFERNRLEYHPEQRDPKFRMLLGLLGTEQFTKTYGYTP